VKEDAPTPPFGQVTFLTSAVTKVSGEAIFRESIGW